MSVAILTYHSLDDTGSVISVSPQVFAAQMQSLANARIPVVPLRDVPRQVDSREHVVAITFDDGFRNFREHAAPVLTRHHFPATVFLVTGHCGGENGWPTQPSTVSRQPLLDWADIKSLHAAGIAFGAHSQTHPFLTRQTLSAAESELVESKQAIEQALGEIVDTFAYPYGDCNAQIRELTKRHFRLACGVGLGYAARESDLMALDRLDMYYWRDQPDLGKLFAPRTRAYVGVRAGLRAARRLLS